MYMKWPLKESPFSKVPCQGRDVEAVMVDGRWLMRDGALLTIDEASIVQEADRIGRVAWQRLFAERPALTPLPGWHPFACEG
jgi:5-methylthioadenosine/S-adenosylhomocysteine deaminase